MGITWELRIRNPPFKEEAPAIQTPPKKKMKKKALSLRFGFQLGVSKDTSEYILLHSSDIQLVP